MNKSRELSFKIEMLGVDDSFTADYTEHFIGGKVTVGDGGARRKCSFELRGPFEDWYRGARWKLSYGFRDDNTEPYVYYSLGIFIIMNPEEKEVNGSTVTSYQGVDKTKLYDDYQFDVPMSWPAGTNIKDIVKEIGSMFGQEKYNMDTVLGTLGVERTFEEGKTAKEILNTILSSFSCEWFFDVNGILIARKNIDPKLAPIKHVMDDLDTPLYIDVNRSMDEANYYNRVVLVGGTTDTPIYRAEVEDVAAIGTAGGRIVQRYYTRDAATTQAQVDALAAYYLSMGVSLPTKIELTSLVLPDLEIGDILTKDGIRYVVRSFDIPMGLSSQKIEAGEIL